VRVPQLRDDEASAVRRLERLQALRSAAIAMSASHDLRLTLCVIAQQAVARLQVSAAALAMLDPAAGVLRYAEGAGFRHAGIRRSRLALGEGYLGRAGLERRWVSVPDLAGAVDFRRHRLLEGEDFVAYFALPLVCRGELLGVLELFHRDALAPDDEWREFAETIAAQAAIALDNARLRERLGGPRASALTVAETRVLRLLAGGHSNRDIGQRAFLSENTVKYHLRHVYRKLGVRTRAAAVAAAVSRGWL
jgi:DNA-binding CsgD family transcriptional regulator